MKFLRGIGVSRKTGNGSGGLWPSVFNVATKAEITTNATCGHTGRQEFCRMGEGASGKGRCGVCDGFSPDPGKRHPITNAIDDGPNKWWQSPALHYGNEYSYVTITLDLKQWIAYKSQRLVGLPPHPHPTLP
ncbi:PREDICTED: laminin subunit alpha-1-like [Nicrophorus vespilloides]|uniref:Laminin subunit alpha-1-like n=1 Tax=Nicrophorus vespilloides TaxID=110193 RepID=A0ABM1MW36_NICVS|nr:PREDICTED: laminin subunit alpha-1-like [Nicrophorus vespilloides]